MSKLILSYLFKTNLAAFRSAIFDDNTDRICRILDVERDYLNQYIDSEGNTALLLAIEYASPLTVRLLLEQGAQPDQPNGITFQTPLGVLASKVYEDFHSHKAKRAVEIVKILLDHGAYIDKPSVRIYRDTNNKDYYGKETPLMTSVRKRNLPLTKLFIERKANVNYTERQSQIRAIQFAVTNGDEAMFDLLEDAGALCCSVVTGGDNNLLHWFCYNKANDKHITLLNKLLNKGCAINAQNWEQRTPLMVAAKNSMIETCRILLKNQANFDQHDSNGNQAIDLSIPGSECANLLLQQIKLQLQKSPLIKSSDKILWRQRLDSTSDKSKSHSSSSKCSDGEEAYIHPIPQKNSEEIEKKYEPIWEKLLHTNQKRRILKKLYKHRSYPVDTEKQLST